eukprot:scaffold344560_cov33-Prasinocladus_malaysianus.AAC.1
MSLIHFDALVSEGLRSGGGVGQLRLDAPEEAMAVMYEQRLSIRNAVREMVRACMFPKLLHYASCINSVYHRRRYVRPL